MFGPGDFTLLEVVVREGARIDGRSAHSLRLLTRRGVTLLGVSRQTVNALETGRYDPSLPLAFKIARIFEQPIESIFSED